MSDSGGTSRRHWRFDWRLMLFSGLFLPLLLGLGLWQLDRAAEKEQLLSQWQDDSGVRVWSQLAELDPLNGQPVDIRGRYGSRHWLLDNRTRDGMPGYEVLTDFHPDQGPPVVINRGWLQAPRVREQLPEFSTPSGTVTLRGRISDYPQPPVLMDAPGNAADGWPRRVQALPREQVAEELENIAAVVIRLDGGDQPGAFRADWKADLMGPQTHYGYALQWFSLAFALVILTTVASYRKTGATNDNQKG